MDCKDRTLQLLVDRKLIKPTEIRKSHARPRKEPRCTGLPDSLSSTMAKALKAEGYETLYMHQVEAIAAIQSGRDVVISTPTASGKTLCYNIPVLEYLSRNPQSHALYLFPMKALANDQIGAINQLTEHLGNRVRAFPYDGDTPQEHRSLLRKEPPALIFTNPDMLHLSFLRHNNLWDGLLRNLKFVVIDEAHEYRGFFGSNVAFVIRRLLQQCHLRGAKPQIIICSATIANAEEHSLNLTGRANFALIKGDSAGQCLKHLHFVEFDIRQLDKWEDILRSKISKIVAELVLNEESVIVFCPTRKSAERFFKSARREFGPRNIPEGYVAPYRSGYTADERREIEKGLKEGNIRAVFSTNALEIGIDIGRLDVGILLGFPDTIMSAWQRAGRVGRSVDKEASIIFVSMRDAIDHFYANHSDVFMKKPLDNLVVNLKNEDVLESHAKCLLFEVEGLKSLRETIVGPDLLEAASELDSDEKLIRKFPPHAHVNIRNASGGKYAIVDAKGSEIGSISGEQLMTEAYIGAVYQHMGASFRVMTHGLSEIQVEPHREQTYTKPLAFCEIRELEDKIAGGIKFKNGAEMYWGQVTVNTYLQGYTEHSEKSNEVLERVPYDQTYSQRYKTQAAWIEWPSKEGNTFERIHVVEHLMRQALPFIIPCDPYDVGGQTQERKKDKQIRLWMYDTVKGGIGISYRLEQVIGEVLKTGVQMAKSCKCKGGCPLCIQIKRCIWGNERLEKKNGIGFAVEFAETCGQARKRLDLVKLKWV